ncbi:protein YLS7-like [Magnolia sinica]|uniref:protein YLS7-like n=1 Tax=Magnolia sinica TaxID=86752 RepID=UPI00265A874C|nr:protein YLS7-like [Magnolia sinica]
MLGTPKGMPGFPAFPRSISSIVVWVGGLALFLILASWILISYPVGVDQARKSGLAFLSVNQTANLIQRTKSFRSGSSGQRDGSGILGFSRSGGGVAPGGMLSSDGMREVEPAGGSVSVNGSEGVEVPGTTLAGTLTSLNSTTTMVPVSSAVSDSGGKVDSGASDDGSTPSSNSTVMMEPVALVPSGLLEKSGKADSRSCDLYRGKWFRDPAGPLYTNNTCPIITQMQNCQGNGRPDKDYENWRWKPEQCDLPRLDPKKFLELMRGKTLAFIGDSVARNQFESMLCILWQAEAPKNRGNRRMQRWYFSSADFFIVRIWSSWLVHRTSEPFQFAPEGVDKLHLDAPDEGFMEFLPRFDVVVLSSGHWFAKQSVYILNNEIVGGQLWWPDKSRKMKIDNVEAFAISVETILTAMATHPNYTGITIVRSYSPDHYEGGAWNTGGSCTGKVRPALQGELALNGFTEKMHEKQVMGFQKALKKATNKSKLRLMDITEAFGYRPDGHPGPYRSPDPNKKTKRGPHGEPPPQDCLHWCMPGPVDTWNELVLEIIRRELEDA